MEYYFSAIDAPQSICLLRAMLLNLFMTVHYGLYVSIFSSRQEIITFAMVIFFFCYNLITITLYTLATYYTFAVGQTLK